MRKRENSEYIWCVIGAGTTCDNADAEVCSWRRVYPRVGVSRVHAQPIHLSALYVPHTRPERSGKINLRAQRARAIFASYGAVVGVRRGWPGRDEGGARMSSVVFVERNRPALVQ